MSPNTGAMASEPTVPERSPLPNVEIRLATPDEAPALARIWYDEVHWGLLREFGVGFLTVLNRAYCTSRHAHCLVAIVNGRIVGYSAGLEHIGKFFREFVWRYGVQAALAILPRLFSRKQLKTLWMSLTYQSDPAPGESQSEMMVLVVSREFAGRGIGWRLMDGFMAEMRARGVPGVRLGTVTEGNDVAINAYIKYGFKMVRTHGFHGSNRVHVMEYRFADHPQG